MKLRSAIGFVWLAMIVAGCGNGASEDATAGTAASGPEAAGASAARPADETRAPGRDISALRACEIVTPQEAAGIIGGKLLSEPPAGLPNCAYVVEVGRDTETYRLTFAEPKLYVASFALPDFKEKAERLTGLWDEAYVHPRELSEGFSVIAVRRGDIAVEVSGERKEPAIEIAKLATSRVK